MNNSIIYIVRSVKNSSDYKIFDRRIDALRFIDKNPSYVLE